MAVATTVAYANDRRVRQVGDTWEVEPGDGKTYVVRPCEPYERFRVTHGTGDDMHTAVPGGSWPTPDEAITATLTYAKTAGR